MQPTVVFDSDDLGEIEAYLSKAYSTIRLHSIDDATTRTRIERCAVGDIVLDELLFTYDMAFDMEPLGAIYVARQRAGTFRQRVAGRHPVEIAPGEVMVVSQPDKPFEGRVIHSRHDLMMLDEKILNRVAASSPRARPGPIRLTGYRPVSDECSAAVSRVLDHIRALAHEQPQFARQPLVAASTADYVAAALLSAFPSTAFTDPTIEDRRDSTPALLRRATAYIDENAHRDIPLTAIAEAIYVTPRALQYMFRKHLDCTPTEYLRKVRLDHVHRELLAADRTTTSVSHVAAKWGFTHVGRFAAYYRAAFGQSPHDTLRR